MTTARRLPLATSGIFLLAAIVGGLGGLAGVGFREGLLLIQELLMGQQGSMVDAATGLSTSMRIVIPAVGGLVAGSILWLLRRETTPFGVSDTMDMVGNRRSFIHPLRSLAQVASSGCSLASGGSIGREGAITQLGTTLASVCGGVFRIGPRNRIVLLACGTAAGMASSYNAPLAGAIFVMEVVLGSFAMEIFAPLVVASVSSRAVTYLLLPDAPAIYESNVEIFGADGAWPIGLVFSALVLGLLCGVGGVLFSHAMLLGKKLFSRVPGTPIVRLALGGLAVGVIGVWVPEVWGNGKGAIDLIRGETGYLHENAVGALVAILVFKVIATSLTTGSGALGGVFTPTLVVGASFGAFFSFAADGLVGLSDSQREILMLVGMAGICAATTHAPITSIFLIFELTQNYQIILPVMLCSISASLVARMIHGDSFYTARLRTKSTAHTAGLEELALEGNTVCDVMETDAVCVDQNATIDEVMDTFSSTRRDTIYVVDKQRALVGRINLHDIKYFLNDSTLQTVVIAADLTRQAIPATPGETLARIIDRFDDPDLEELAVVESAENQTVIGRVTRRDLMACLSDEVLRHRKLRTTFRRTEDSQNIHVQLPEGSQLIKLPIPDHFAGRTVGSIEFPDQILPLIVVQLDSEGVESRMIATPSVVLAHDSKLILLGPGLGLEEFEKRLGQD